MSESEGVHGVEAFSRLALFDRHNDLIGAYHIELRAGGGLDGARVCPQPVNIALEGCVRVAKRLDFGEQLLMFVSGGAHLGVRADGDRRAERERREHDCQEDGPRRNESTAPADFRARSHPCAGGVG